MLSSSSTAIHITRKYTRNNGPKHTGFHQFSMRNEILLWHLPSTAFVSLLLCISCPHRHLTFFGRSMRDPFSLCRLSVAHKLHQIALQMMTLEVSRLGRHGFMGVRGGSLTTQRTTFTIRAPGVTRETDSMEGSRKQEYVRTAMATRINKSFSASP